MVIKSSYYGPTVMLRKNKIANLSVLFQLYFQWHEIWVDIHVTENRQRQIVNISAALRWRYSDPTESEPPSSLIMWTHKVAVMLSLIVPVCFMG